ncbi:MAG: hypothetical protein ACK4GD_07445 [Sphingomonadaceae bacterium]
MTADSRSADRPGDRIAAAALALVGTRFRLHGRDPAHGLDCIGLAVAALQGAGFAACAPRGYRLRNRDIAGHLGCAARSGLAPAWGEPQPGDVLLVQPGPLQQHLLIAVSANRFVHAHAGLGRVTCLAGPLQEPVLRHWRIDRKD